MSLLQLLLLSMKKAQILIVVGSYPHFLLSISPSILTFDFYNEIQFFSQMPYFLVNSQTHMWSLAIYGDSEAF